MEKSAAFVRPIIILVLLLGGCALNSPQQPTPKAQAYAVPYYPQQEPFYAADSAPVILPSHHHHRVESNGCRSYHHHYYYSGTADNQASYGYYRNYSVYPAKPYPINPALLFPNNLHAYDWSYWQKKPAGNNASW